MVSITLDPKTLEPLVDSIVQRVLRLNGGDDRMIPEAQVAEMLGISTDTLQGERRRKRITALRGSGNRIFYTPKSIRQYIATRETWERK